jgi:hypothetical protein
VEAPAVEIEEGDDIEGRDLDVEGVSILQVVVPHFIHDVAEKFGASTLSGFVVCEVLEFGFVCCFRFDTDDSSGIVWDGSVIERRLVVILDGSLFYVTVPFSFLLVYGTSKKKVVFFPLKLKA